MEIERFAQITEQIEKEIGKVIVGQQELIRNSIICIFTGGNILLEGVPGLGKTLLVKTIGRVLSLSFNRIQFTPDLMPADIIGTNIITTDKEGNRHFTFQPGPVFANIVLADEINRATPKTQSALLEAMQEKTVTAGGHTRHLDEPFFVMATQNPLEMEGTYPLPEAQMDRFLFKLMVSFPDEDDLIRIITRERLPLEEQVQEVIKADEIREMTRLAAEVLVSEPVNKKIVRLILATHPDNKYAPPNIKKYVRYGASPRGAEALTATGKARALMEGRYNVAFEDIEKLAYPALRHRIFLNFEGQAQGLTPDDLITDVLQAVM